MRLSRFYDDGGMNHIGLNQAAIPSCRAFMFCPVQTAAVAVPANGMELYRLAYEQAQAMLLPPRHERLFAPSLN